MFFQQVAGAALATGVAVLLVAWDVDVRSSLVVAAGIVVLLAGLSLVAAIGLCGELLTERLRIPPMLVAVCGIVPLLPGLAIYRGLFAIVVEADIPGRLDALVGALAIGLALAAGVALGEYPGRPVSGGWDLYDQRARRRATTAH